MSEYTLNQCNTKMNNLPRDIQTGDLLFFRPTGWVGRLICAVTKSEYCHVGLAFNGDEGIEIREFREFGYREILLEQAEHEWGDTSDVWRHVDLCESTSLTKWDRLLAAGNMRCFPRKYGYFHFAWVAFYMLFFRRVSCWFVPKECDEHAPTCSEAVCHAYRLIGRDLVPDVPDRLTSPGDIIKAGKVKKVS